MTNREAIEWFRTKYAKVICDDCKTPVGMAISALQAQDVPDTNVGDMISRQAAIDAIEKNAYRHTYLDQIIDIVSELPSAQPDGWLEQNKDKILQAGMEGREIDFRIGGRLFAIREKAQ